jgi:hypothetical protein
MGNGFKPSTSLLAAGLLAAQACLSATAPAQAQQAADPAQSQAVELQPAEMAFEQRIRAAFKMMTVSGGFDAGYKELRAALAELAQTGLFAFTVKKYTEAGQIFHQNDLIEEAEAVFSEGEQVRAMQEDVRERPDFYLAYAQFKVAARDFARVVPLFTAATNLYAEYYGRESVEVINANDLLAVTLGDLGQYGTAANLFQGNYELALRVLGPDDRLVWRLANNFADTLRAIGAPSRALEYDLMVLQRRTEFYGRDHFNVLVSANNTAQDYLDLRDYAGAQRYFELNRQIAVALKAQDPGWEIQAETWLTYTRMLSGEEPFDDFNIETMDGLITNAAYPTILSYKAARLLADHFATTDAARSMKHLEQALNIATTEMSPFHPLTFSARRAIANARSTTEPTATAADYAKLDIDMIEWLAMQVMFAGSRDFADATRALADDMLYDYARHAEQNAAMVPAFADAARRWPALEDGRRDTVRKLIRLIDPGDEAMHAMLRRQLRLSLMNQEFFAAGGDEAFAYATLEESQQLDDRINERLSETGFDPKRLDTPLPTPRDLLATNEAFIAYFITRRWGADRQGAEPFDDVRLYGIVWRKDGSPSLHYLGDPRIVSSQGPTTQLASLRSGERGAVPIVEMGAVFSDLHTTLIAPLESVLAGANTIFIVPDGQLFAVPFSLLEDGAGRLLEERYTIRVLTRPESLYGIAAEQSLAKGGRATLAGGLDYTNGAEIGADPLPGTLQEVEAIAALFGQGPARQRNAHRHRRDRTCSTRQHGKRHGRASRDARLLWQSEERRRQQCRHALAERRDPVEVRRQTHDEA